MRPGRAADHSRPSSAAIMEQYSYTSTHPLGHTGPVTGSLYLYLFTSFVSLWISRDSRDSSVGTASRVRAVRKRNVGSILGTGKIFSFIHIAQTGNGTHRLSYLMGTGDSTHETAAAEA